MALNIGMGLGLTAVRRETQIVSAAAYASYAAPAGYRWEYETYNGVRVTYNGEPVVALVRIS
jgi:hypothetical protein